MYLLPEVFEEGLHGVVVGLRQLIHQLFDALHSLPVVVNLYITPKKEEEEEFVSYLVF